ncbi:segregation and condensation protein A [Streptomyces millisiae]|uniref:Segregation and condensation protein A n=1 Tax=Streptomyces millisiae TaxID=3075542 RepID=A0ABU2LWL2_9ACTN|nr:segregation/condensation protein A [Streptomyces sp. DSM 44918]MDT0321968.1 segregation/condensation protein A [Streptomyces sp. DSM 44918]
MTPPPPPQPPRQRRQLGRGPGAPANDREPEEPPTTSADADPPPAGPAAGAGEDGPAGLRPQTGAEPGHEVADEQAATSGGLPPVGDVATRPGLRPEAGAARTDPVGGAGAPPAGSGPASAASSVKDDGRFKVVLENFEGPFDLLLQLISRHKLDVTEVALSRVTDEFMAYIRAMGPDWDLDQTTEFLVVAATLLDLKAARLLPAAEVEDEADLALLEARDLLFARLLQYRAFKRVADIFAERLAAEALRHPRTVGLEPHHAELLPDVVIRIGPEGFARLAVKAMQPKPRPQVYVDHIHAPLVSVREQAEVVIDRLRQLGRASFGELVADAPDTLTVVARFLALLELYRERAVTLDQEEALGTLVVAWSGGVPDRPLVTDEFDQESTPRDGKERP